MYVLLRLFHQDMCLYSKKKKYFTKVINVLFRLKIQNVSIPNHKFFFLIPFHNQRQESCTNHQTIKFFINVCVRYVLINTNYLKWICVIAKTFKIIFLLQINKNFSYVLYPSAEAPFVTIIFVHPLHRQTIYNKNKNVLDIIFLYLTFI